MVTTTERIIVDRPGGPKRLRLCSVPLPEPEPGEVRIRVESAGVAFADIMVREGRYPGVRAPVTPGYDFVGRVEALGQGVNRLAVGARVGSLIVTGGYARHVVISADDVVAIPESLEGGAAVSLILNYVTAWQMLWRNTALAEGDTALVHGAAGGVGTALLELCRLRGVRTIGTASPSKHDMVLERGGLPLDYRSEDFAAIARRETGGKGVDAVFDHLGGAHLLRSYAALKPTGVLVSYGGLSAFRGGRTSLSSGLGMLFGQPRFTALKLLLDNRNIVGFDIAGRRRARPDWFASDLLELAALAEAGRIVPAIAARFPLHDARRAHEMLGAGEVRGKIILDA